jgi:hypothetical protein
MDVNIVAAIFGLVGVLFGSLISYFAQIQTRKWSKEDAKKTRKQQLLDEQRKIRREFLDNRLKIIEEVTQIRMFLIDVTRNEEFNEPIHTSKEEILAKRKKEEELSGKAWVYLKAIDSRELKEHYQTISKVFHESEKTNHIESDDARKVEGAYTKLVRLIADLVSEE